jgi:hypothetical protein
MSPIVANLVLGIKALLEERGLTVYVDWISDPQLDRSKVTADTADHLRARMRQCDSLIYAVTTNATSYKWMPWEVGYFDGHRGKDHIAIMPFVENQDDNFSGQEYLSLYAVVRKDQYKNGAHGEFVEAIGRHWMPLKNFTRHSKAWQPYTR